MVIWARENIGISNERLKIQKHIHKRDSRERYKSKRRVKNTRPSN